MHRGRPTPLTSCKQPPRQNSIGTPSQRSDDSAESDPLSRTVTQLKRTKGSNHACIGIPINLPCSMIPPQNHGRPASPSNPRSATTAAARIRRGPAAAKGAPADGHTEQEREPRPGSKPHQLTTQQRKVRTRQKTHLLTPRVKQQAHRRSLPPGGRRDITPSPRARQK